MSKLEATTILSSGIVVDESKFQGMKVAEQFALFAQLSATGKRIVVVDSAFKFFTPATLLQKLDAGDEDWRLIAEHFRLEFSPEQIEVLRMATMIRANVAEQCKKIKPAYELAKVPQGWSLANNIQFDGESVKRVNGTANFSGYYLSLASLEKLWKVASRIWAGETGLTPEPVSGMDRYASSMTRKATVFSQTIEVGCQTIYRYEIEQIALAKGWAFP